MNFTASLYEHEMKKPPNKEALEQTGAPKGSRCCGCPYWRGILCVSCYRELLKDFPRGR